MSDPLVSVILPTYNRPDVLIRALASISAQSFQDYEVIVVNDGGKHVGKIVKQIANTVYLEHDNNRGLPAARNTAIRSASGKYIAYLDDDDIWYIDHLSICVNFIQENNRRFVYTDCYYWYNECTLKLELSLNYSRELLRLRNLTPVITIMHERSLFDEVEYFDESLPNHEDYDLWLRMSEVTDFYHIPIVTCAYSKRSDNSQMSANARIMRDGLQYVQQRYSQRAKVTA